MKEKMASSEDDNSSQSQAEEDNLSCLSNDNEYDESSCDLWEDIRGKIAQSSATSNSSDNEHSNNDNDSNGDVRSVYEIDSNNDEEAVEILEENNNDPNNNMGDENNESHGTIINERSASSPQPGCSRAFDVIETDSNSTDLNKIAQRILQQISNITHESIVVALKKAQIENNKNQISLSELLPVTKVGLKRPHMNYAYSVNIEKVTLDKPLPTESSTIQAGLFLTRAFVDLTGNDDIFPVVQQPEAVLNYCNRATNYIHKLSPTTRNSVIDVELDSPLTIPSTSNQSNGSLPIISGSSYAKPITNLPNPESDQRKVHISECIVSDSGKHNKAFMLQPSELSADHESQVNEQSNQQLPATIVIDEYIEIPKGLTDNELSTEATRELHLHSLPIPQSYIHKGKTFMNTLNSKGNSNASATIISNNYIDEVEKVPNETSNASATTSTTNWIVRHHHHHPKPIQQPMNSDLDTRIARKCFVHSTNTIGNKSAHTNVVKAMNGNQKHGSPVREKLNVDSQIEEFEAVVRAHDAVQIQKQMGELEGIVPASTFLAAKSQHSPTFGSSQGIPSYRHAEALNGHQYHSAPAFMNYRDSSQPGPSRCEPHTNQSVCVEIYQKLRAIFPNLKREYIKKFCPSNWAIGSEHDVQVSNIVDRILTEEPSWEYDDGVGRMLDIAGENYTGVKNVEETCEYLAGLFPDADPHYLRDEAIKFKDENAVQEFMDQQLKNHNYPTREQYLAKLKITQEQKRYTKNFDVAEFLKIFPEPFQYFEDPKRKCQFSIVCLEFLKAIHNRMRVHTISNKYVEYNHNMSLATKHLKSCNEELKTRRASREIPTSDIPILQEMAFIRYQDAIREYIDQIQSNERSEFNTLKSQGKLCVCQCCYDDECMPSKCSKCENGHIFCNSCIIAGTDSKLGDGEAHVPCFLGCGSEFSLSTLQKILSPTKFSIVLKKRQAAEVMAAGLEGLVSCPFCHFASIPAEGDKVFKCLNPECMKESCIKCKEPNHVPLRCHEVDKTDKARKFIEEKMTQALARSCYKCKRSFFKEEGCNKITCPCGAVMCYLCDKPIKDYTHFAGQGSEDKTKCPLWTDNQRLNAETVRKVAEVARSELLRQDPTLIINTDGLAPELPPPTNGPHNHIVGAHNIAVQLAARVMKKNRK